MGTIAMYSLMASEIEDIADTVKACVLRALASDGLIEEQAADNWAAVHTVIVRKKTVFRTLTSLWRDMQETDGLYYIVVEGK